MAVNSPNSSSLEQPVLKGLITVVGIQPSTSIIHVWWDGKKATLFCAVPYAKHKLDHEALTYFFTFCNPQSNLSELLHNSEHSPTT